MKKVIFLCIMVAIVIIIAGVHSTKVSEFVVNAVVLAMFAIPMSSLGYVLVSEEIESRRNEKARRAKETKRKALHDKYAHLAKGLTKWMGDALLSVEWCEYSSKFRINYEHPWKRYCVRGFVKIDGNLRDDFYAVGGYTKQFLNKEHEEAFEKALHTLIGRIEDTNAGILFESK